MARLSARHCKRPYKSDVNILSYLWNEYSKLNAKYCYGTRSLDMHAKMPYTSDANIFTYLRKENNKLNAKYCFVIPWLDMDVKMLYVPQEIVHEKY